MTAICFDLDGTLTDPREGIENSIRHALQRLGRPVPEHDDLTWCIGPPLRESFETLLGDRQEAEAAVSLYREYFADAGIYQNRLYPGIGAALDALAGGGHRLFVATSKPTVYATQIIEHFGLTGRFERVFGSELDGTRADKTDLLSWILEREDLEAAGTTMVGDRRHDIIGARNNGMRAVGVLYGYGDKEELSSAGATWLCPTPDDLTGIAN